MNMRKDKTGQLAVAFPLWMEKIRAGLVVKFITTMEGQAGEVYEMRPADKKLNNTRVFIVRQRTNEVVHAFNMHEEPLAYMFSHLICADDAERQVRCVLGFNCPQKQIDSLMTLALGVVAKQYDERVYFTMPVSNVPIINMFLANDPTRKLEVDVDFAEYRFYH